MCKRNVLAAANQSLHGRERLPPTKTGHIYETSIPIDRDIKSLSSRRQVFQRESTRNTSSNARLVLRICLQIGLVLNERHPVETIFRLRRSGGSEDSFHIRNAVNNRKHNHLSQDQRRVHRPVYVPYGLDSVSVQFLLPKKKYL